MKLIITFLIILISYSSYTQETVKTQLKNHISQNLEIRFDDNPFFTPFIFLYQREMISFNNFTIDAIIGSGNLSYECEFFFCPTIKTGLQFSCKFKNSHRIFTGFGNTFSFENIYGKARIGYSYQFTRMFFLSFSYENYIWVYTATKIDYYEDEDGNYFEDYNTTYNNWGWDISTSSLNLGIGITF